MNMHFLESHKITKLFLKSYQNLPQPHEKSKNMENKDSCCIYQIARNFIVQTMAVITLSMLSPQK